MPDGTVPRGLMESNNLYPESSVWENPSRTARASEYSPKNKTTQMSRVVLLFPPRNPVGRGEAGNAPTAQGDPQGSAGSYTPDHHASSRPCALIGWTGPSQGSMMGDGSHLCNQKVTEYFNSSKYTINTFSLTQKPAFYFSFSPENLLTCFFYWFLKNC